MELNDDLVNALLIFSSVMGVMFLFNAVVLIVTRVTDAYQARKGRL